MVTESHLQFAILQSLTGIFSLIGLIITWIYMHSRGWLFACHLVVGVQIWFTTNCNWLFSREYWLMLFILQYLSKLPYFHWRLRLRFLMIQILKNMISFSALRLLLICVLLLRWGAVALFVSWNKHTLIKLIFPTCFIVSDTIIHRHCMLWILCWFLLRLIRN